MSRQAQWSEWADQTAAASTKLYGALIELHSENEQLRERVRRVLMILEPERNSVNPSLLNVRKAISELRRIG